MFHYLYEVRCNLNGKIYVGVHRTKDLNDGYMGSGKVLGSAIKKYGVESFTKTILEYFESKEEMYSREKEIVTEEFLARDDTYNLRRGGTGGFDYINRVGLNDRSGVILTMQQRNNISDGRLKSVTDENRKAQSERMMGNIVGIGNKGNLKKRSDTHRQKISESAKKNIYLYHRVTCPHCGIVGAKNAMLRWHFDKCKMRV